jgi:hypothetical protein
MKNALLNKMYYFKKDSHVAFSDLHLAEVELQPVQAYENSEISRHV